MVVECEPRSSVKEMLTVPAYPAPELKVFIVIVTLRGFTAPDPFHIALSAAAGAFKFTVALAVGDGEVAGGAAGTPGVPRPSVGKSGVVAGFANGAGELATLPPPLWAQETKKCDANKSVVILRK